MRNHYRFQIQGPNAKQLIEKLNGGPIPTFKFFSMDYINIGGRKVRCLAARHGRRAGSRDLGTLREGEDIRAAILDAGKEFGWFRSARALTPPIRWNPAGFPRRCPRFTPARR